MEHNELRCVNLKSLHQNCIKTVLLNLGILGKAVQKMPPTTNFDQWALSSDDSCSTSMRNRYTVYWDVSMTKAKRTDINKKKTFKKNYIDSRVYDTKVLRASERRKSWDPQISHNFQHDILKSKTTLAKIFASAKACKNGSDRGSPKTAANKSLKISILIWMSPSYQYGVFSASVYSYQWSEMQGWHSASLAQVQLSPPWMINVDLAKNPRLDHNNLLLWDLLNLKKRPSK